MEVEATKEIQPTENTEVSIQTTDEATSEPNADFSNFMLRALGGAGKTQANEEELFAAIIERRLEAENPEAANLYSSKKAEFMSSMARADGYVSVEDVANASLKEVVAAGLIDEEMGGKIKGEAFAAAQLDDNLNALYDGRGSGNDPTIAVAEVNDAMSRVEQMLKQIDSGELQVDTISLDSSAPSGAVGSQPLDGSGGFLWKPESESDGNLVVLLPTELRGQIDKVEIHSEMPPSEENKLGEGRFAGDEHNGARLHYRFDKPGAEYGNNAHVVAYKDTGEVLEWLIPNGADRND